MMCQEVEKALDRKLQEMPEQVSSILWYVTLLTITKVIITPDVSHLVVAVCGSVKVMVVSSPRKWRSVLLQKEGRRQLVGGGDPQPS